MDRETWGAPINYGSPHFGDTGKLNLQGLDIPMNFTDGNWMMQPGVTAHYGAEVYQAKNRGNALDLLVPTRKINHRGDTLGGPTLDVALSSPLDDVICVNIKHFRGGDPDAARFRAFEASRGSAYVTEQLVSLTSGELTVSIDRGSFAVEFSAAGKKVTSVPNRGCGLMQVEGVGNHIMAQLTLGVGELVYGLGERFTSFTKNGQKVDIWNEDGGTCSYQAYKNIPFYLTNEGYGVFVNHTGRVSFEVATERTSRVQFSVPGEGLEFLVIYGPTPKEILRKYTDLMGKPALPPAWSFGLWLSTSFTTNYDEKTVNEFIDGMESRGIPLSVFHYDCFWMRGFHWCDFKWDPDVFPDPEGMLDRLHHRGLKVCAWINPYIAQASELFEEGKQHGYFLKRASGDVWQWDMWQPGMALVDFTNPAATAWYQSKLAAVLDQGVDSLKTDFGERVPTDVVYHDGSDPVLMHNLYTELYNRAVFELLEQKRGKGEAVLFARSATAGGQQYPCHWGGDCWSDFEAMAESLRGGLSLCLSGFGFWSHDIGGFEGLPPEALYHRWVAFGLMSTHSRLHGSTSYRVPWAYGEEAVAVLRFFTRLKLALMPYLWSQAKETHETGVPMLRAMILEFPNDPTCAYLDRQYMLGESLLVAPVFSTDGSVTYCLPSGGWYSLLTGERREGGTWVTETHDALSMPLWVREGAILEVAPGAESPGQALSGSSVKIGYGVACDVDPVEGAKLLRG